MSVPTWKRQLSGAEYIYQTYQLNIRLGEILVNKPQKYKQNYADEIIKTGLSALGHVQIADSIYLGKSFSERDYLLRREQLVLARGEIHHVATSTFIYLEIVRKHDYASDKYAKIYDQEMEVGERCEKCYKLISGVIKSDSELRNKYIKSNL